MKWSDTVRTEVMAALLERLPDKRLGACPICRTTNWTLHEVIVAIEGSTDITWADTGFRHSDDRVLPCAALSCTNCGNTHFLNLGTLGLAGLLKKGTEPEKAAASANTEQQ